MLSSLQSGSNGAHRGPAEARNVVAQHAVMVTLADPVSLGYIFNLNNGPHSDDIREFALHPPENERGEKSQP